MTIHVFGNSHVHFSFGSIPGCRIHYQEDIMMYQIGHRGLRQLDIRKFGVEEGDVVIYLFGGLDVRAHIGRQRDEKDRDHEEVIYTLCLNYIAALKTNEANYRNLTTIVALLVPPSDTLEPGLVYGSIWERVQITQQINRTLRELGFANGFKVLDLYTPFKNAKGVLSRSLSDGHVHVREEFQGMTQALLETLLNKEIESSSKYSVIPYDRNAHSKRKNS